MGLLGKTEIVKILIDKNLDVNAQNIDGNTSLHRIMNHYLDNSNGCGNTFFRACAFFIHLIKMFSMFFLYFDQKVDRKYEIVKLLVDNKADINLQNNDGFSILHQAVEAGKFQD